MPFFKYPFLRIENDSFLYKGIKIPFRDYIHSFGFKTSGQNPRTRKMLSLINRLIINDAHSSWDLTHNGRDIIRK